MKDFRRYIIWLDYFNSAVSRSQGRRVPLSHAVRHPKPEELVEAVRRIGYAVEAVPAFHPKRSATPSCYISIDRAPPKHGLLLNIAKSLSTVRGEARDSESSKG